MSEKREVILEAKHVTRRFAASHGRTLLANNDINLKMWRERGVGTGSLQRERFGSWKTA